MKEIEHKYLVTSDAYRAMATGRREIIQGYLSTDPERTVRVRIADDKAYLTVKGKNIGDTRLEFEYHIPVDDAHSLMKLCVLSPIHKVRWIVPFEGFVWEVDEFLDHLAPLVLAEIELPSSDIAYTLPPFVGENVTHDAQYYNSNLSKRL